MSCSPRTHSPCSHSPIPVPSSTLPTASELSVFVKSTMGWVNPSKAPAHLQRLKGCFLTAASRHSRKGSPWRWSFLPAAAGEAQPLLQLRLSRPALPQRRGPGGAAALRGWRQRREVKPEGFVEVFCRTPLSLSAVSQLSWQHRSH